MEFLREIGNATFQAIIKTMHGIHTYMVSMALDYDLSLFTTYIIPYIICGLLGVLVYKYMTHGPANPFGDERIEQVMFWGFIILGPFGLIIAIVDAIWYLFAMREEQKAMFEHSVLTQLPQDFRNEISRLTEEEVQKFRNLL